MNTPVIVFDPALTVSYPAFKCPICQSKFFGGGKAIHQNGCPEHDYEKCHWLVGPKMINVAKQLIADGRGDESMPICSITPNQVKSQLPAMF